MGNSQNMEDNFSKMQSCLDEATSNKGLENKIKAAIEQKVNWAVNLSLLAKIIGDVEALKFAEAFGGVSMYIPQSPVESSPICHVLSEASFAKLCSSFLRGSYFNCPRGPMANSKAEQVRMLLDNSFTQRQIALFLQMSANSISRIAARFGRNKYEQASLVSGTGYDNSRWD